MKRFIIIKPKRFALCGNHVSDFSKMQTVNAFQSQNSGDLLFATVYMCVCVGEFNWFGMRFFAPRLQR